MAAVARSKYSTDAGWAQAAGLPKETLSRLKGRASCDLRTLDALARAAGYSLAAVPAPDKAPARLGGAPDVEGEGRLIELCASGNTDAAAWSKLGTGFFMGGLAVLLAGARGFDRERYLRLAEALHVGVSTPEVFGHWLEQSPVQPSSFLPKVRMARPGAQ